MAINNTLKDIREERNLIQADLAEAIGSCSQTIGRIERGAVSYTHLMSSHHQPADWLWSVLFRSIISSKKFLTSYNPIAASSSCSLHEMSRQLLLNIQLSWFILGSPLTSSNY